MAGISGQVRDLFGNGVSKATLKLEGSRSASVEANSAGAFAFDNLPSGSYTITPLKTNYTFAPEAQTIANLNTNQTVNFVAAVTSGAPILVSESASTRAIALTSPMFLRDPFPFEFPFQLVPDKRTRVMLFFMNFDFQPGEDLSIVKVDAEDASHRLHPLPVEYVGRVGGLYWLNSVVVRLSDEMVDLGDVLVRISVRGVPSNRVRLGIGHISGGLPDDIGAIPTPGREP